eukprot:g14257.t1
MLTVVRRAVPGSTRPRRRAAAAAAGAQQQSSALHLTSSGATAEIGSSSLHQRSFFLAASSGSPSAGPSPVGRPLTSGSSSHSYPALPSPRWEVAGQGSSARSSPKEARFVGNSSSTAYNSTGRGIATKAGGAEQEHQCRGARGSSASSAAGERQGAEMVVNPKHAGTATRGSGGGRVCAGSTTTTTTSRRWLWTAAAMTAVTAVTATVNTASATPCNRDATIASSSPSLGGRRPEDAGGLSESDHNTGGGAPRGSAGFTHHSRHAAGNRGGEGGGGREAHGAKPPRKSSWRSSLPAAVVAASSAQGTAAAASKDSRPTRQLESPRSNRAPSLISSSWLDGGGFLLRRGVASVLDLRGGARAMSAPATGGGGGGKSSHGSGKKAKAGGAGGKEGDESRDGGGENRGKSIPLAGRPLFTSVASTKGHRPHMEDEFFLSADGSFSAVYDGHGGANVSEYLRRNLYKHVMDHLPPGDDVYGLSTVEEALRAAFKCADDYVVTQTPYSNEGSCAVSVTVHCDREGKVSIISCNLGDSRAVLSRGGKALDLTEDHKPNAPREMERIYRHDGMVTWEGFECSQGLQIEGTGVYRINGNLAVARAIGDIDYRPWVSAEVDIKTIELKREADQFVILASDGLWDVMSSEEAVQYVHAVMGGAMGSGNEGDKCNGGSNGDKQGAAAEAGGDKPPHMTLVNWTQSYAEDRGMIRAATMLRKKKMAGYLAEEALRRGTMDNTTVAIVWLQ